jgi:hypothetical protein
MAVCTKKLDDNDPAGVLLLAGLWTPVAGSLVAILGLWKTISQLGDPWACILSATIGIALALLGPGARTQALAIAIRRALFIYRPGLRLILSG